LAANEEQPTKNQRLLAIALGAFIGSGSGLAGFSYLKPYEVPAPGVTAEQFAVLHTEFDNLRTEFDRFSSGGRRYTSADAAEDRAAVDARFKVLESEVTRAREAYLELKYEIKALRDRNNGTR
jgi:hypothetical protein